MKKETIQSMLNTSQYKLEYYNTINNFNDLDISKKIKELESNISMYKMLLRNIKIGEILLKK